MSATPSANDLDSAGWSLPACVAAYRDAVPDAAVIVHGERRVSWADFDRRTDALAAQMVRAGLNRQDRVALYLHNAPEYVEGQVAALKASLIPVNTNYRYVADELVYLWENSDAAAVVFHGSFVQTAAAVRPRVPGVKLWLWVDDGTEPCPRWAVAYEQATQGVDALNLPWSASPADLIFLYTGGTTGLPKGVIWRQDKMLEKMAGRLEDVVDLESAVRKRRAGGGLIALAAPPLMHGAGLATALQAILTGGTIVLLVGRRFDAVELWDAVAGNNVESIHLVGDAHARPLLHALDANPRRWKLTSVRVITSTGAMFSEPVKTGLLGHLPSVKLVDSLGSSEASGSGYSVSVAGKHAETATFTLRPGVRVVDEDGRDVVPGSGEIGMLATPNGAEGYHKDPVKSAQIFRMIDGVRYTVPGDYASIDADGTARLLGRGSGCINTGGEKVFPEEVEEALKMHAAVVDALVIGTPDERFGEVITAVVSLCEDVADGELAEHVKARLAGYKAPRHLVRVDSVPRLASGKPDYAGARTLALDRLGAGLVP